MTLDPHTNEDCCQREYLGDGVYVANDGWHVWLYLHDGMRTTDAIALEPPVLKRLNQYRDRIANTVESTVGDPATDGSSGGS